MDEATKKKQIALAKRRETMARKKAEAKAEATAGGKAEEDVVDVPSQEGKVVMAMVAQICERAREAQAPGYDH